MGFVQILGRLLKLLSGLWVVLFEGEFVLEDELRAFEHVTSYKLIDTVEVLLQREQVLVLFWERFQFFKDFLISLHCLNNIFATFNSLSLSMIESEKQ